MFSRRASAPEDSSTVKAVEQMLATAEAKCSEPIPTPTRNGKLVVDRAVWLCACVTFEDAPTWLIHSSSTDKIGWRRIPDGVDLADVVDARVVSGDHVDPDDVLRWLQDPDAEWLPSIMSTDDLVVQGLGRRIRELQSD